MSSLVEENCENFVEENSENTSPISGHSNLTGSGKLDFLYKRRLELALRCRKIRCPCGRGKPTVTLAVEQGRELVNIT